MGRVQHILAATLTVVACAYTLPSWTQETKPSKDKTKSEFKTWPRAINYRGLTPLERATAINGHDHKPLLNSPESSDWRQVADLVRFSPPTCMNVDEYEAKTEEGKRYTNSWSKTEGALVTSCLAYLHRYCPNLFKIVKSPLRLKKLSIDEGNQKEICFLEANTFYFRNDLFGKNSNAALLAIGAALVKANRLADKAYQHPDWVNCLKRIEPAAAYLKTRYSATVIEDIDGNLARLLVAPNLTVCSYPKAALEQTLVMHSLTGGRGTPFECQEFLTTTMAGIKVKADETTVSAKNKKLVDKLNTLQDLKNVARLLNNRFPANGTAGYVIQSYRAVIRGQTAGSLENPYLDDSI